MTQQPDSILKEFQTLAPGDKKPRGKAVLLVRTNTDNFARQSFARSFTDMDTLCDWLRNNAPPEGYHYHLEDLDLRGKDLTGAWLDKSKLIRCDLGDARMSAIKMAGTALHECNLQGADLRHANLRLSWLDGIDFSGAIMDNADMTGSVCTSADFTDAKMRRVRLSGSCAQTATFTGADLRDSKIDDVHLELTRCANADMRGSDMQDSNVSRADFSGVRISRDQMNDTKGTPFAHPGIRPLQLSAIRRIRRRPAA